MELVQLSKKSAESVVCGSCNKTHISAYMVDEWPNKVYICSECLAELAMYHISEKVYDALGLERKEGLEGVPRYLTYLGIGLWTVLPLLMFIGR